MRVHVVPEAARSAHMTAYGRRRLVRFPSRTAAGTGPPESPWSPIHAQSPRLPWRGRLLLDHSRTPRRGSGGAVRPRDQREAVVIFVHGHVRAAQRAPRQPPLSRWLNHDGSDLRPPTHSASLNATPSLLRSRLSSVLPPPAIAREGKRRDLKRNEGKTSSGNRTERGRILLSLPVEEGQETDGKANGRQEL